MNMLDNVKINACPLPFSDLRMDFYHPEGMSLSEMIHASNIKVADYASLFVFVNGDLIEKKNWVNAYPKQNDIIAVNVIPEGGGGGGKNVLRVVALLGVIALAIYAPYAVGPYWSAVGPGTFGGALLTTGVGIGGALAVNALIPPPQFNQSDQTGTTSPSMSIGGLRNQANLYAPIQRIFGTHRFYPPYAAEPYTEFVGDDLYGRYCFFVGKGDYGVSSFKIGATNLTEFEDYEISYGDKDTVANIYPNDVHQDNYNIQLTNAAGWQTRTTPDGTQEIILTLTHPAGLWVQYDSGNIRAEGLGLEAQYAVKDSGQWHNFPDSSKFLKQLNYELFYTGFTVKNLTAGEYDVRVRKYTGDSDYNDGGKIGGTDLVYWTAMNSIQYQPPVEIENAYLIALKIRLSNQITQLDTFNCMVQSKLSKWNGSSWTSSLATNNPAWAYAEVLRGNSNKKPVSDSKIDGDALLAWAQWCDSKGFEFNRIVDYKTTVWDLCGEIASIGRASRAIIDNRYSIILDLTQTVPVQHFTPRNSWGFNSTKIFQDIPHGLKCKFMNEDSDYIQDEIIVYRDGYTSANATDFETFEFWGATSATQVWKLARYHLAVAIQRPEVYEINVDFESLVCKRGDMVRLTYDVLLVGLGSARIKSIAGNNITLDDSIIMEAGKSYGIQCRRSDGTMLDTTISLDIGEQRTITLASVQGLIVGDLVSYGEVGSISLDCIVQGIEPGPDLTARLKLQDYATAILDYDGGEVPVYDPVITIPPKDNRVPPTVTIESVTLSQWPIIKSDSDINQLWANVNFSLNIGTELAPSHFQGQSRFYDTQDSPAGYTPWINVPVVDASKRTISFQVQQDKLYDFRIRSVGPNGETSDWDTYSDYAVTYNPLKPNNISGLQLVQGGPTWEGLDCEIKWTLPADTWRLKNIKINIYKTTPLTLLRTEYVDFNQVTYSYSYVKNQEDNSGTAVNNLTFRLWAVSNQNVLSNQYAQLAVTNPVPANISGLTAEPKFFSVDFYWAANSENDLSHYLYRVQVESDGWSDWYVTRGVRVSRSLTDTEKTAHGATANIQIEVVAVDTFGQQSATPATANDDCTGLTVQTADVDDYQLTPSKFAIPLPLIDGLTITNNDPSAGYVSWTSFNLYLSGTLYSINSGNSNNEFIVFKDLSTTLAGTDTHPSENWGDWDPAEDFLIIWNNSGTGKEIWSTFMNLVSSSAFIGAAAIEEANIKDLNVTNAKILDLDGGKITANTVTVGKFDQDLIDSYGPIVSDPTFALTSSSSDSNFWNQTDANVTWDAAYGESGPGIRIAGNSENNDLYLNDGQANTRFIPASKNDKFYVQARIYKTSGFDASGIQLRLYQLDEGKNAIGSVQTAGLNLDAATTWETHSAVVQAVEDDCHFVYFRFRVTSTATTGYVAIDDVYIVKEPNANFRHSSDVTMIDGGTIYTRTILGDSISLQTQLSINDATFGNDGVQFDYNSGNPRAYVGDGSNNFIKFDGSTTSLSTSGADALVIKSGGDVKLESGGDIKLYGSATDPALIQFFDPATNAISEIGSQGNSHFDIVPSAADKTLNLGKSSYVGGSPAYWDTIYALTDNQILIKADDSVEYSQMSLVSSSGANLLHYDSGIGASIGVTIGPDGIELDSGIQVLNFSSADIYPDTNLGINLGIATTNLFDEIHCQEILAEVHIVTKEWTSAPTGGDLVSGGIYRAAGNPNWDPLTVGTHGGYLVWYTGSNFRGLNQSEDGTAVS